MRYKFLLHNLSILMIFLGISMLFPLVVAAIYEEDDILTFAGSFFICVAIGAGGYLLTKGSKKEIGPRDGFAIVAIGWIVLAFFGSLPYLFSGSLHSLADAYFESVSGFTTTGSTVVTNVEQLSYSILFWRSLTQWLGGMGIILLSIAILPLLGVGGMQLYKAEVPGPVTDKLKPRIGETAKLLWKVYILFTLLEFIFLKIGGMGVFDALCHSFTTMATGGFSTKNISVEAYGSAYIEGVITVFMLMAGINFALHYQLLKGKIKTMIKDNEFIFYIIIIAVSIIVLLINLMITGGYSFVGAFRYSSFQILSILTTTGYSSVDFEQWSHFSQYFLLLIMFMGGCAGSTAGGIKCLRIFLLFKQGYRELYRLIHPRAVVHVKFNNTKVSSEVMDSIWGFFFLFMVIFVLASLIMSMLGMDILSSISSVIACLSNIGPGFGTVGPYDNFAHIPSLGKWVLSLCMLLGRLEIYTLLILLVPEYWNK